MGEPATVTFKPAPADHGIVFIRTDRGNARVPANIQHVVKRPRRTCLRNGDVTIDTCEHALSALAGLAVDNAIIEMDGPELPALDGSAKPYLDALKQVGIDSVDAPRQALIINEPVVVKNGDAMIVATPCPEPYMQVIYDLDYGVDTVIGRQVRAFDFSNGNYADEIAPARTYCLEREAMELRSRGLASHLTAADMLVLGDEGPLGGNSLRYTDEPVRHKIVDLIGDLYLLGAPIHGRIFAYKSGHALNHALVRKLIRQHQAQRHKTLAIERPVFDIRRLTKMLPHRYPMLLVDRVVELDGARRAVGIKNVTINEPFFQGHYPGTPIMPGVLVVEAMAQLSGVLIGQSLEHTGKLAVLLSLDRVKLRKPVTPGDQLVLEAESVRVRSRIAHMRCRAYVGENLVAEAEVKFMLVDDEE